MLRVAHAGARAGPAVGVSGGVTHQYLGKEAVWSQGVGPRTLGASAEVHSRACTRNILIKQLTYMFMTGCQ